tara:strand:+ start:609 stop:815 length:207 start_codon:yes stop_codon:yes gene_type:complete
MNLKSMDKVGYETYLATKYWRLSDWKSFRRSVKNYYELKDKAYLSGNVGIINKFREFKLKSILKYNKQ